MNLKTRVYKLEGATRVRPPFTGHLEEWSDTELFALLEAYELPGSELVKARASCEADPTDAAAQAALTRCLEVIANESRL